MERIGTLAGIYIRQRAGAEMVELEEANVIETGIEGDAYAEGNGTWQVVDRKNPPENKNPPERPKKRAVSGLSKQDRELGNLLYGTSLTAKDTRRNFEFDGMENIQEYLGRTIQIGETVQIDFTDDCNSCTRPSSIAKKPGYEKHGELGGVRGIPRKEKLGKVKKGDPVFVV